MKMCNEKNRISLELMNNENIKDIFEFELENRFYFIKNLPPRPIEYFTYDSFTNLMIDILEEQSRNECAMYVIRNEKDEMVGRVNMTSMNMGELQKAEIGYRIGERYQRNGYATEAVRIISQLAFNKYHLLQLEAGTSTTNLGSQKVLERNGFIRVGREINVMKINGEWVDGYLYKKVNNPGE